MEEKSVCFAGHRDMLNCIGIEKKLLKIIEDLIKSGYTTFYDGAYGAFDAKSSDAVLKLKKKYPNIKLILVLTYYHPSNEKYFLPSCYDGSVYPDLEKVYPKAIITKRNEWIVDNSDVVVCHIEDTYKSGAYKTYKYAKKKNKKIINI